MGDPRGSPERQASRVDARLSGQILPRAVSTAEAVAAAAAHDQMGLLLASDYATPIEHDLLAVMPCQPTAFDALREEYLESGATDSVS